MHRIKINASINDFPFLWSTEKYFRELQNSGIDGIELVIGVKTRWHVKKLHYLSHKYSLPVASIHQPIWSGLGVYFDTGFVNIAKELDVKSIVCHPLPKLSLESKRMQQYLQKLSRLQKEFAVQIMLENLPVSYSLSLVNKMFRANSTTTNITDIFHAAQQYNLQVTCDISHLHLTNLHTYTGLAAMLPRIGNIHLSSFTNQQSHLPLDMGDFETKQFILWLKSHGYHGLLTLEIYYPKLLALNTYDSDAIRRSVAIIREAW